MRTRQVRGLAARLRFSARNSAHSGRRESCLIHGLAGIAIALALSGALACLAAGITYASLTADLPSLAAVPLWAHNTRPTRLLDRSGQQALRTLAVPGIDRRYLPLDPQATEHLSEPLARLTVAALDPTFRTHPGFLLRFPSPDQPPTLAERLVSDLLLEEEPSGLRRDLRTRLLAAQVTAEYGRDQVLEWYLNSAYYGHLAYGADAAAQTYFGKPASQLDLAEAATLVAASQAPALNPADAPEAARSNQQALLKELYEAGELTADEYHQAAAEPLEFRKLDQAAQPAEAFTSLVLDQLESRFGRERLERGGLDVYTTLDYDLQAQAACAALALVRGKQAQPAADCPAALLLPTGGTQSGAEPSAASLLVTDPGSGQILALVGETGLDGESAAFFSHPAGSLLTPWVYFAGFTRGMGPASLVWDVPSTAADGDAVDWSNYHGPLRLRIAMANDYLAPAYNLLDQFGASSIWKSAEAFGLKPVTPTDAETGDPSGRGPLSPLEAAQAYGVFANGGVLAGEGLSSGSSLSLTAVLKVVDDGGRTLLDWSEPQTSLVISPALAYLMNASLSDESARWPSLGHPNALEIGRPVGAKLGQTPDGRDAWAVGYTPQRLAVVWTGQDGGGAPEPGQRVENTAAGLWRAVFQYATRDLPVSGWEQPAGVSTVEVCDPSGLLPSAACPSVVNEIFLAGNEPTGSDNLYRVYQVNRETGLLATVFTPPEQVEDQVFMALPAEALDWARATGVALAPDQYDSIQAQPQTADARLQEPAIFSVVKGAVQVRGSADGADFAYYRVQVGEGLNPQTWIQVGPDGDQAVRDGQLASWDTTGLEGLYAIRLLVVHTDQQVDTATIQVTVDNTPPVVSLDYPADGQVFDGGDGPVLAFQASAVDEVGLARVEWILDGARVAIQTEAPYSLPWKATRGDHTLQVTAYDQAGNRGESAEIRFSVTR